jgi:2-hydroxy-3-keto-5-methylthiopentenyl-1-phosphate phosphatase
MIDKNNAYKAIVSSDWNECLAPCGPFDFISFNYPQLTTEIETIFKQYTGNSISLGEAIRQIQKLLPAPITEEQMDHYLDKSFTTYNGVPELIEWCRSRNILFMINTTGMIGYFQKKKKKNLLPKVPVLSAHPLVRYPKSKTDPPHICDLLETMDKCKNTESVVRSINIPSSKIIIMGDSGGDGPHFKWGAANKAFLVANMMKPSLQRYCDQNNISIDLQFGLSYKDGKNKDLRKEMQANFMDLAHKIEDFINR